MPFKIEKLRPKWKTKNYPLPVSSITLPDEFWNEARVAKNAWNEVVAAYRSFDDEIAAMQAAYSEIEEFFRVQVGFQLDCLVATGRAVRKTDGGKFHYQKANI